MKRDSSSTSVGVKVPNFVVQKARMLSPCLCQRHPGINPDRCFLLLIFFPVTKSSHMWLILYLVKSFWNFINACSGFIFTRWQFKQIRFPFTAEKEFIINSGNIFALNTPSTWKVCLSLGVWRQWQSLIPVSHVQFTELYSDYNFVCRFTRWLWKRWGLPG